MIHEDDAAVRDALLSPAIEDFWNGLLIIRDERSVLRRGCSQYRLVVCIEIVAVVPVTQRGHVDCHSRGQSSGNRRVDVGIQQQLHCAVLVVDAAVLDSSPCLVSRCLLAPKSSRVGRMRLSSSYPLSLSLIPASISSGKAAA